MVTIKEVLTKQDIRKFVKYPLQLYKDNPYYVPDILADQIEDLQKNKNPAFEYCQARCFLAYRDGEIVGRIAGILNDKANAKFKKKYLTFSQVDFIDDDEVVDALFDTVEKWARELNCEAIHGPLGFSDMDREGMLVEGFDRLSLFYTYYNHPYYKTQLTRLGYEKEVDWIELRLKVPDEMPERVTRVSDYITKRKNLHVVELGDKPLKQIVDDTFALYNKSYLALFGVVPMTDAQAKKYSAKFRPLVNKRTTTFIYNDKDEMVAFGVCSPALEHAQQKSKGRMFPFGWARLLRALHGYNDVMDMLLIAVDPQLQGSGVNAVIINNVLDKIRRAGFKYAETGPMLAENEKIIAQWSMFEGEQHKRRRCFVKNL